MADIEAARRFLAAEFESAGLPHAAGGIFCEEPPHHIVPSRKEAQA